jgi:hypothetical protein
VSGFKKDRAACCSLGGPVYISLFPVPAGISGRTEKGRRF